MHSTSSQAIFGANLRLLRSIAGLTQEQMSAALNIARSTYASFESGSGVPSALMLCDLAEILGVDINTILDPKLSERLLLFLDKNRG